MSAEIHSLALQYSEGDSFLSRQSSLLNSQRQTTAVLNVLMHGDDSVMQLPPFEMQGVLDFHTGHGLRLVRQLNLPAMRETMGVVTAINASLHYPGIRNAFRSILPPDQSQLRAEKLSQVLPLLHPQTPIQNLPNLLGSRVCMEWECGGESGLFMDASAGWMALSKAFQDLLHGLVKSCLIVAVQSLSVAAIHRILASLPDALDPHQMVLPVEMAVGVVLLPSKKTDAGLVEVELLQSTPHGLQTEKRVQELVAKHTPSLVLLNSSEESRERLQGRLSHTKLISTNKVGYGGVAHALELGAQADRLLQDEHACILVCEELDDSQLGYAVWKAGASD